MNSASIILDDPTWVIVAKGVLVFALCVVLTLLSVWGERRIVARMQMRMGPNRVGPFGLIQALASCSQSQYELAYQRILRTVLNARIKSDRLKNNDVPPKDLIMLNAIIMCLDTGNTWSMVKKNLLGSLEASNRTKKSIYLDDLFDSYIKPIEAYSNYDRIDSVLEQIGYVF